MQEKSIHASIKAHIESLTRRGALRGKVMRGGAWIGTGSVAEQVVRFARNMILARLLMPSAFGTMAIVLSSASLVDVLTDVGMTAAIIQNPRGSEDQYLNASWWMSFGRACLSYLLIFTAAPWISHFYGRPEISGLLRVALLGVLFNGALSPRAVLAQREMRFGRWATIMNGGGICGVLFTIALSFEMRNVWALAIGYCGENAFRLLLSYVLCPGIPRLRLDWIATKELLTYSKGIFGLALLNLIAARADIFVLGRLYPLAALGTYTLAVQLVNTPSSFLTGMLGQTLLPALSSVQNDIHRLNRILLELTSWLLLLGLPAAVFISLVAPSLLRLIYGARYAGAAGPLAAATAAVAITVLNAGPTLVLFAKGQPALHRRAVVITAATILVTIYPACKVLGPVGGQITALIGGCVGFLYQLYLLHSVTALNLLDYAAEYVLPTTGSMALFIFILISRSLGLTVHPFTDAVLCGVSCLILYGALVPLHLRSSRTRRSLRASDAMESASTR